MSRHYIGCAGLHECMSAYCASYENYADAVADLAQLHELGKGRTRELAKNGYLELNLHKDGNEYCEIIECNCKSPEDHQE